MTLKEEKASVTSGTKKISVLKETVAVSVTIPKIVRKNRTHCRHTFRASHFTRWKCVEEEKNPRQK